MWHSYRCFDVQRYIDCFSETGDSERFESRDFDYLLTSAVRDILGSCGPDFKVWVLAAAKR